MFSLKFVFFCAKINYFVEKKVFFVEKIWPFMLIFVILHCIINIASIMKKILMTTTVLLGSLGAEAYDYPYLTLQKTDGTAVTLSVEQLQLTFADGKLTATNSDGSQTMALTDLNKMFFTDHSAGIDDLSATDNGAGKVDVYAVDGKSIGTFDTMAKAKESLRPGLYIMKTAGRTIKMTVK